MVEFDAFRQHLATALRSCAARRRQASAPGRVDSEDVRIAALLDQLAADARNLDLHVFLLFELMLTHKRFARRFVERGDRLLADIGVTLWPADTTALLRLIIHRVMTDPRTPGQDESVRTLDAPPPVLGQMVRMYNRSTRHAPQFGAVGTLAADAVTGLGLLAPILAVWEVGRAIGQWQDQAASTARPAVTASVISSDPIDSIRHRSSTSNVVLTFKPSPTASSCQVAMPVAGARPEPGATMSVVPRSANCEPPILVSEIGDPAVSVLLAAALTLGALAAFRLRGWLGQHGAQVLFRRGHRSSGSFMRWAAGLSASSPNPRHRSQTP